MERELSDCTGMMFAALLCAVQYMLDILADWAEQPVRLVSDSVLCARDAGMITVLTSAEERGVQHHSLESFFIFSIPVDLRSICRHESSAMHTFCIQNTL